MIVELWDAAEEIKALAQERAAHKRARGAISKMRWKAQTLAVEEQTLKSEFAVARALGVDPSISRRHGRDPGYDVIYRDYEIEVKYTEYATGKLTYNPELHEFEQDIWVLAIVKRTEYVARIAGWVWRTEMPKVWYRCAFDKAAWCVDQQCLTAMKNLINIHPKDHKVLTQGFLF
jgi:hypothetical protein